MGKLPVLSCREVCAILIAHGFAEVRHKGSHIVMQRRAAGTTITVPVPDHRELRTGTLLSKQGAQDADGEEMARTRRQR